MWKIEFDISIWTVGGCTFETKNKSKLIFNAEPKLSDRNSVLQLAIITT
jgi:hypothetical protein